MSRLPMLKSIRSLVMLALVVGAATIGGCNPPSTPGAEMGPTPDFATLDGSPSAPDLAGPRCDDGRRNGGESDVDCGGKACPTCAVGDQCVVAADCGTRVCRNGVCVDATCSDKVENGGETDVDCGGNCEKCDAGMTCNATQDCLSGVCAMGRCAAPSCDDGIKNSIETDIDCGGGCPPCADMKRCVFNTDCMSGFCHGATVCVAPNCMDRVHNGSETDVDCGGMCPKCETGLACKIALDCVSSVCAGNTCAAPMCADTVENGLETDVDCGGGCPNPCADGLGCRVPSDCRSSVCDPKAKTCSMPSCIDQVKNGSETDIDCGGGCVLPCADGKGCQQKGDCTSGICNGGRCIAPACNDGVRNGSETDVDCGGGCAPCGLGQGCMKSTDCKETICDSGRCRLPSACKELHVGQPLLGDGLYSIDPDGAGLFPGFVAYCDMTNAGGGWTLVANRTQYIKTKYALGVLGLGDAAMALPNDKWAMMRAISTETIAAWKGITLRAKLSDLAKANCEPLSNDLTADGIAYNEDGPCNGVGLDYSVWFGTKTDPGRNTYFSDYSSLQFFGGKGGLHLEPVSASMFVR